MRALGGLGEVALSSLLQEYSSSGCRWSEAESLQRQNDMGKRTEERKDPVPGTPSFRPQKDAFPVFGTESNGDKE